MQFFIQVLPKLFCGHAASGSTVGKATVHGLTQGHDLSHIIPGGIVWQVFDHANDFGFDLGFHAVSVAPENQNR
jgi:hypothetical protein